MNGQTDPSAAPTNVVYLTVKYTSTCRAGGLAVGHADRDTSGCFAGTVEKDPGAVGWKIRIDGNPTPDTRHPTP